MSEGFIYLPFLYVGEGGDLPPYGVTKESVGPSHPGVGTGCVGAPPPDGIKNAGLSHGVGPSPLDTKKEGIDLPSLGIDREAVCLSSLGVNRGVTGSPPPGVGREGGCLSPPGVDLGIWVSIP